MSLLRLRSPRRPAAARAAASRGARAGLASAVSAIALALPSPAAAVDEAPERPSLPAWSPAGDDGAASIWSNPANLSFDPDPSYAVIYTQGLDEVTGRLAAATNLGPLGLGIAYDSGDSSGAWWTLSSGLGLRLDRHLALGVDIGWQLPDGADNNFVTWDVGLGWRPLSWLGLAGVAGNIGNPQPALGVEEFYTGSLALRPWGDLAMLGADVSVRGLSGLQPVSTVGGTLRLVPVEGLVVRLSGNQLGEFGAGLEMYFGSSGVGAHGVADTAGSSPLALVYAQSSQEGERLFGSGKKVPEFVFEGAFPYQPTATIFASGGESYIHLLERLRRAAEDPSVKAMVLHLDSTPFSFAQIQEIRELVAGARQRGKTVVAYLDRASSNGAYLLASSADRVFLHPAANLDLIGLSMEMQFYKGPLDLVGIEVQAPKRSEYKSGPEAMTRSSSSGPAREQLDALLDDINDQFIADMAEGRGRSPEQLRALVDQGPFTAQEAVDKGLVDELAYPDEVEEALDRLLSESVHTDDRYGLEGRTSGWRSPREIAVVYVDGGIISGPSTAPGFFGGGWTAGSDTISRQLKQARRDPSVKAVVLRVDSPGGSSFASDEIWHEVERVQAAGKPVIVSMGGVAASGGYYVSAGATAIYAMPTTITGSIGVYSTRPNAAELFENLGIGTEIYRRGRHAALYSLSRPMDAQEYAAVDRMVGDTYAQFKSRVATGRRMSDEKVEEVARGRVWSGTAALDNGLVDELGSFHDAVARARTEAGIRPGVDVELVTYSSRMGIDGELARSRVRATIKQTFQPEQDAVELPRVVTDLARFHAMSDELVWMALPYTLVVE